MDTAKAIATLRRYPYPFGLLASMKECSRELSEALVQCLPSAERKVLLELGIVRSGMPLSNGLCTLEVTEFGFQVIAACPELEE